MEKIYWISNEEEQRFANEEIARYGGHVAMISAVPAAKDQRYCAHAFVVVVYPKKPFPDNYD